MGPCARDSYRIGQVAKETEVSVETVRYYERFGLLPRPPRTAGGERRYGPEAVARVRFIKQAQSLGLRLREILELVGDERRSKVGCRKVHAVLTRHLDEIDRRIRDLRELRRTLSGHRLRCEQALAEERDPACPMLVAMEREPDVTVAPTDSMEPSRR